VRSALNGIISANSAAGRSSSTTGDASTSDELSQEEYVNLMSVLEAELLMEEDMLARESQQAALAAFEAACGLESYADNLLAQQHSEEQQLLASTGEEAVLCPVCEQAYLIQTAHGRAGGIVACRNQACQLRLDCAAEGLTLDNVRRSLASVIYEHSATGCNDKPAFEMREEFGVVGLWMGCNACGRVQMVI